jgi:hypothetical protein
VVSQVDCASWCAVTGIFSCYSTGENGIAVLKAGKISEDQISRPMMLFSNGALINPNVIPQLSHFAPVWIKKEIQTEDIYLCSPDAEFIKSNPQLQPSMRLRERDVAKCIKAQTNLKIANLPITNGQFRVRRHQKIRLEYFSDWCQHLTVAKGIRLLANETGKRHRAQDITNSLIKLWSAWEHFLWRRFESPSYSQKYEKST